ncbi:MAG: peptide-methionine (S)-S-oxide reductase MsrA [Candidatus Woesearchaeota archaeon]
MRYIKILLTSTVLILIITLLLQGCSSTNSTKKEKSSISFNEIKEEFNVSDEFSTAVFSGGCFWCVEKDFEKLEGVVEAISGYTSNSSQDEAPTYQQVASGSTNFRESVLVIYDSTKINFKELVEYFLIHHDPTDMGGSFYDRGFQYTSAIYYQNSNQKNIALNVISAFQEERIYEEPIITSVEELTNFYMAEEYHQDYYKKNPLQYRAYRFASGRDRHISSIKSRIK